MLYRDHCQQCHKADARGDGRKKPSLRSPHVQTATDGDLEWFLRQGDLARGMPTWSSLPQAQRWQVIAYLRSLQ
jgi:mono/diheme cytochrome c family protein